MIFVGPLPIMTVPVDGRPDQPGIWNRTLYALDQSSRAVMGRMNNLVAKEVDLAVDELVKAIHGRGGQINLQLRAIDDSWLDRKAREGWETGTLRRLDLYVDSISSSHKGRRHSMGVASGMYPGTHITYQELASFLENGTRSFDPIPHWSIALDYLKRRLRERVGVELRDVVRIR
jgi:hypothetical protein